MKNTLMPCFMLKWCLGSLKNVPLSGVPLLWYGTINLFHTFFLYYIVYTIVGYIRGDCPWGGSDETWFFPVLCFSLIFPFKINPTTFWIDRSCLRSHFGHCIFFKKVCVSSQNLLGCRFFSNFQSFFIFVRSHVPLPGPTTMLTSLVGTILFDLYPNSPNASPWIEPCPFLSIRVGPSSPITLPYRTVRIKSID